MFQLIFKVFEQQQPAKNGSLAPTANQVEWDADRETNGEKEIERDGASSNHILRYDGRCQQTNKWQTAKGKFFIVRWLIEWGGSEGGG